MWRLPMKVDEVTLQNILKAYGKDMKANKNKIKIPESESMKNENTPKKLASEDLEIINYDKEGKVAINPKKKDALIDFFQ
jgi:hypothetical protein